MPIKNYFKERIGSKSFSIDTTPKSLQRVKKSKSPKVNVKIDGRKYQKKNFSAACD